MHGRFKEAGCLMIIGVLCSGCTAVGLANATGQQHDVKNETDENQSDETLEVEHILLPNRRSRPRARL